MSNIAEELLCSAVLVRKDTEEASYLFNFYKVAIIFFITLTITATLGNSLILVALHKDTSLHPPSKLLLRSLTITDLFVGAISQPILIILFFSFLNGNSEICRVFEYSAYVVTTICSGVSLFTLTAIGVDRLLALLLRLQYRHVVTVKRVRAAIFVFWVISIVVGVMYIWNVKLYFIATGVSAVILISVSTYCYTRIFHTIRRQQTQVQDAFGIQKSDLNMTRYKKTVFNALWVHLTLASCYLPFSVATAVIALRGYINTPFLLAEGIAVVLVILNSSLNPVLYCWKIKEVRLAVKETVGQMCTCFSVNELEDSFALSVRNRSFAFRRSIANRLFTTQQSKVNDLVT
ncbi:adenosine receptor A3-like [Oculina patagonica]